MLNRPDSYDTNLGSSDQRWVELFRHRSLEQAMTVVTSVAAMEFDVRLIDDKGRAVTEKPDELDANDRFDALHLSRVRSPEYIVQVRCADWQDLDDILASLIEEQQEFDDRVAQRERVRSTIFVTGVVATSAVAGYSLYRTVRAVMQ